MKKWLAILLVAAVLLAGCAKVPADPSGADPAGTFPAKTGYEDGVIGGGGAAGGIGGWLRGLLGGKSGAAYDAKSGYMDMAEGMPAPAAEYAEAPVHPGEMNGPDPQAGLLTAREWSDRLHIGDFADFLAGQEELLKARELSLSRFVEVSGIPGLTNVQILAGNKVLAEGVSDVNGLLVFALGEDAGQSELTLTVGGETRTVFSVKDQRITSLKFDPAGPVKAEVTELDFMLMVDTTGSMGDELEYLKKELENVIETVYKMNPQLSIRTSVNFYRDEGDEYVVKYYDFREDVQDAVALIEEQSANGGGDTPEAVHTALDNAVFGHTWREGAVKLCYLVLDAPPHQDGDYTDVDAQTRKRVEHINETLNKAVKGAAAAGIRIIPVVASGADKDLEVLGRSWAFQTGGTYIYLTNDSGIGYWHETPEVPETELEYLNDCMIRVTAEYCGLSYEAERHPQPSERQTQEYPIPEPYYYGELPGIPGIGDLKLVKGIFVHSLPEGYKYSFTDEAAVAKLMDYFGGLKLTEDFPENPDEYGGMTWVVEIADTDGGVRTLYHFGNMFLRMDDGPWYKMDYEEAVKLPEILDSLK